MRLLPSYTLVNPSWPVTGRCVCRVASHDSGDIDCCVAAVICHAESKTTPISLLTLTYVVLSQMNPTTEADALNLATGFTALLGQMEDTCAVDDHEGCTEVVIFPPFPFISKVKDIVGDLGIDVGAQQIYYEDKGAFTGSVAASMVKSVGCEYVLCGHSERRTLFSDSDVNINAKVSA